MRQVSASPPNDRTFAFDETSTSSPRRGVVIQWIHMPHDLAPIPLHVPFWDQSGRRSRRQQNRRRQNVQFPYEEEDDEPDNTYERNLDIADQLGNVGVGVTNLNRAAPLISIAEDSEETCPVCMDPLEQCIGGIRKTLCNHSFCHTCAARWFRNHKKCPICNTDIEALCASLHPTNRRRLPTLESFLNSDHEARIVLD